MVRWRWGTTSGQALTVLCLVPCARGSDDAVVDGVAAETEPGGDEGQAPAPEPRPATRGLRRTVTTLNLASAAAMQARAPGINRGGLRLSISHRNLHASVTPLDRAPAGAMQAQAQAQAQAAATVIHGAGTGTQPTLLSRDGGCGRLTCRHASERRGKANMLWYLPGVVLSGRSCVLCLLTPPLPVASVGGAHRRARGTCHRAGGATPHALPQRTHHQVSSPALPFKGLGGTGH
jgi:hypothetical protein